MTDAAYQTIRYDLTDNLATISLDRADKMHSMNRAMRLELAAAFTRASDEAHAILLTSEPPAAGGKPAFCTGQDLSAIREEQVEDMVREEYNPMLRAVANSPIPTIAALIGPAAGAGMHLALSADVIFAAQSAYFAAPFSRLGLMPAAAGSYWIPRRVGLQRAYAMTYLGERVPAEQAEAWGLIWKAVPDDALMDTATKAARRIAEGPTVAFRGAKKALRVSLGNDFETQLELEAGLQGEAAASEDYQEGVEAFLEKRAPRFNGR